MIYGLINLFEYDMKAMKLVIFGSRCRFPPKLFLFMLLMRLHWTLLIRHVRGIIFLNLRLFMNLIWTNRRVDGWGCILIFMTDPAILGKTDCQIMKYFQLWVSRPELQDRHSQIWFYGSNPEAVMCPNCLFWQSALPILSEFRAVWRYCWFKFNRDLQWSPRVV